MRVYKLIVFVCLLCGGFVKSHGQQDPLDINDRLVAIQDSMYQYERAWTEQFKLQDKGVQDFSQLKPYRIAWQSFVVSRMAEVKGMKDSGGSIRFRGAVFTLLLYKKQFIENVIVPVEHLTVHTTITQMKPYKDKLLEGVTKTKEYADKVQVEQKYFAAKNHIITDTADPDK